MIKKHWKKILLGLCTLFWGGCSDDSVPLYGTPQVACELDHMWTPDDPLCTNPYSCTDTYYCHDNVVCFLETDDKKKTFDCRDELGNKTTYTEDEFNSLYYVESERIH